MPDDLNLLADTLAEADRDREADLQELAQVDTQQLAALADWEDPLSDGYEGACV